MNTFYDRDRWHGRAFSGCSQRSTSSGRTCATASSPFAHFQMPNCSPAAFRQKISPTRLRQGAPPCLTA